MVTTIEEAMEEAHVGLEDAQDALLEADLPKIANRVVNLTLLLEDVQDNNCENTDCTTTDLDVDVEVVILGEDFDGEMCVWCTDCIERDNDMVVNE